MVTEQVTYSTKKNASVSKLKMSPADPTVGLGNTIGECPSSKQTQSE